MSLKYRIAATIFGARDRSDRGGAVDDARPLDGHASTSRSRGTEAVTLQLLGDLSRAALLTDEYANLQTFIEGTKRDPRVQAVIIGDAAGGWSPPPTSA